METKQLRYYRLRRDHPDMSPADAMDLASQDDAQEEAPVGVSAQMQPAMGDDSEPDDFEAYPGATSAPPMVSAVPRDDGDPGAGINAEESRRLKKARANDSATEFDTGIAKAINQGVAAITQTKAVEPMQFAATAPGVQAEYDKKRHRMRESLMDKRNAAGDVRRGALDQSTMELNKARMVAALREKTGKAAANGDELSTYKAMLKKRYPGQDEMIDGLASMKGAQDLQNSLDAWRGQDIGLKATENNLAAARREKNVDRGEDRADRDRDRADKAAEDVPLGFDVDPAARPGAETRKKFSALVGSSEKMKGLTSQMRTALKGTSAMSRVLDPKTVTSLKQLATMIRIEGKTVAELGALSGPDMGLMDSIAADPTSFQANLTVDLPKMLDQLDAWGVNSVNGASKSSGIRRKASSVAPVGGAAAAAGGQVKPSPGAGYVRGKVDGRSGWINKAKEDFIAD